MHPLSQIRRQSLQQLPELPLRDRCKPTTAACTVCGRYGLWGKESMCWNQTQFWPLPWMQLNCMQASFWPQSPRLPFLGAFTLENLYFKILSLPLWNVYKPSPNLFPVLQPKKQNVLLKDLRTILKRKLRGGKRKKGPSLLVPVGAWLQWASCSTCKLPPVMGNKRKLHFALVKPISKHRQPKNSLTVALKNSPVLCFSGVESSPPFLLW